MLPISKKFKTAMKQPVKELQAYLLGGDIKINDSDDLISFKISCDSGLCKTAMRKLEAKYLGDMNLLGQWVHVGYGVKVDDGTYEYLDYGSFLVTEINYIKDTGVTTITGYDKMINSMTAYTKPIINYPISLLDYTKELCKTCNLDLNDMLASVEVDVNNGYLYAENLDLELDNDTGYISTYDSDLELLEGYLYGDKYKGSKLFDLSVDAELYENIEGITYRDIFQQIAQATATTCIISNDDKVYFKPLKATYESLTYDNMFKLKLQPKYGEINSVVLSRTPQEDNIFMRDESSILDNGLTEFKIENNELIDKKRDSVIGSLFEALHGISYYPFETTTEGLGWYEIGDSLDIINDNGDVFNTSLFNYSITMDGAVKETLKTVADTKTQTQYQYATTMEKRVKNTEIIVDKQNQYIESIVSDINDEDGLINGKFTKVYQDIDNIINSVQNTGGNNLLLNSVMFAHEENVPVNWEVSGDGTLTISSNAESLMYGCLSGHSFTLDNKKATQRIPVKMSADNDSNKIYYSFGTKIKKGSVGSCYVKIYNSNEEYIISVPSGESAFYEEYEIKGLLPKDNYYMVEIYGSADSDATFTDNMFSIGEYKTQWTQASGEIMNTQVNVNIDGVLVKSSIYLGDYTIMSPLEFAGYSNINGTITKVFTLNKDVTYMQKAEIKDELRMVPIKIVPITEGDIQGWAFVPST